MEEDPIIYKDIIDYIENNNYLITSINDILYYTNNYEIFKDKYLDFNIKNLY